MHPDRSRRTAIVLSALCCAAISLVPAVPAAAADPVAIVDSAACAANTLPRNDDGSTSSVPLPFGVNFYGQTFEHLYVNNNGNVTFDAPLPTYTPFGLTATSQKIIAPFFADVDTRPAGSSPVVYGWGDTVFEGHRAFCVNWVNVGYYNQHADKLNSFQLLLVEREDSGPGDFDMVFNYGSVQWETGDASGGSGGLGGSVARVGFSNGSATATSSFEMPGSGVSGALLDSSATGLAHTSTNSTVPGRHVFQVRSGGAPLTRYVALGDSYQSGEGAGDYLAGTDVTGVNQCHRSLHAYPEQLVANGTVTLQLDFWACSGAVIDDLTTRQINPQHAPWNDPQTGKSALDRLDATTKLVTVGIGGNDMQFADILQDCILRSTIIGRFTCQELNGDRVAANFAKIRQLNSDGLNRLQQIYDAIRQRAPLARIVVVGYPRFFVPTGGYDSIDNLVCEGVRIVDQIWANKQIRTFDNDIAAAAHSLGLQFVDLYDAPAGHELCSGSDQRFLNGIVVQNVVESYHPNQYGHSVIAAKIATVLASPGPGETFNILPGQTLSRTVTVGSTPSASFATGWPGSDVQMSLRSPSGRIIDRATTAADVLHRVGPINESYLVTNPEPGDWSVQFFGARVAPLGEPVQFDTWQQPVPNADPVARVSLTQVGHTVTASASGSTDADGHIADYLWDFGDGSTAHGVTATHTYQGTGTYRISLAVTDDRGGQAFASAPAATTVSPYAFTGFWPPFATPPATSPAVAGLPVPVVFGLGGDQGHDIFAAGRPASRQVDCATGAALGAYEPATTVGLPLVYSRTTKLYLYSWMSSAAWRGTCRGFTLGLNDGSTHDAVLAFH